MTRIALVSCVKSKRPTPTRAADLYTSPLFRGLRRYAERVSDAWYILSAEHGLVHPDTILAPYERTLNKMSKAARATWAERVRGQLLEVLPKGAEVVVLAGVRYREGLVGFLNEQGFSVSIPLEGLSFGRQLQWLSERGISLGEG